MRNATTEMAALAAACLALGGLPAGAGEDRTAKAVDAVAVVGGVTVGRAQLEELAQQPLARVRSQEYDIRKRVLDQHVERLLLEQEAAARKQSVEELTRAELDAKTKAVSDEEVRAYYEGGQDRFRGVPEAQALQQVGETLRKQRQQQRRAEFIGELKARRGVRILLEPPRLAVDTTGAPSKGPQQAPVTIVEFSDFQCPYCAKVVPTLKAVADRYGDRVRIVFRDYPLPFHQEATKAAEAAACAEQQGRFWEMHDKLFANQRSLQPADLKRYAVDLGLDQDGFSRCLDSGQTAERWQRGREHAARYGVSGTPSFFINGRFLSGSMSLAGFTEIIDEELARAAATASAR
jgi:protein-disulfide isomerase